MDTLNSIINVLQVAIIPSGVIMRVLYCLIKMMYSEDEMPVYKKRIVNIIVFGIIAELILSIKDMIRSYYG